MPTRILYDAWPLAYAPLSPAAWQLRTLLAAAPDGVEPLLALPTDPQAAPLPDGQPGVYWHSHDRGAWEQRILPRLAAENDVVAIHTCGLGASLLGKAATLVSPAEPPIKSGGGRKPLQAALGRGGLARAAILWPEDMPAPRLPGALHQLPPAAHPSFRPGRPAAPPAGLPEEYVLVLGLDDEAALAALLESWSWASASIGEYYPLLIAPTDGEHANWLAAQLEQHHAGDTVRAAPLLEPQDQAAMLQSSTAVVCAAPPLAWGDPYRAALACAKAIVAQHSAEAESILGPAGYLVPAGDPRAFGAAIITVVVDEKAREGLEGAAEKRAAGWDANEFRVKLGEMYRQIGD
ncbi:MAG: glycosyltransferase [Anaerolineales bacterium]|nr:glycosyltransferase [Anaerolineales bacterium]